MSKAISMTPGWEESMNMRVATELLGVLAWLALVVGPATAGTWSVPLDAPTIQAGIDSAAAGDTVLVAGGTYQESWITLKDAVVLRGETGEPGGVIVDAQQQGLVFYAEHTGNGALIEGFTIEGGLLAIASGGLYCEGIALTLRDCAFKDNAAPSGGGGGLGGDHVSLILERCTFLGNAADVGGGVYLTNSTLQLRDCDFITNTATRLGGGLACHDVDSEPCGCQFVGNSCQGAGGGVYWTYSDDVLFSDVTFRSNTAQAGGGIFVEDFTVPRFHGCIFEQNEVTTHGGAVICYDDAPLTECRFTGNTAGGYGGALFLGGSPTLTSCILENNEAEKGGAMACLGMQGLTTPTLLGCRFGDNQARSQGGAVWLGSGSHAVALTAQDTDFGGGVAPVGTTGYLQSGCSAHLRCCTTALFAWIGGVVTLDNEGCGTAVEPASWGRVKSLYGD
jgi:predicted outer membrane repeat protein